MSTLKNIKRWFWVHRWTSLICTLFLLLLCLTGLPLIFEEEIDHLLSKDAPYEVLPKDTPRANLDDMVKVAQQRYPKEALSFLFIDDEEPQVVVNMMPSLKGNPNTRHEMQFDARTGKLLKDEPSEAEQPQTFLGLMLSLHTDMFAGLAGELFLCLMGLLFVFSIISGIVLYGPFMKKLDFGTVRTGRSTRLKWLDLHNLIGIATAAWLLVVGITGVINELSTPLFGLWQITDVKKMLDQYKDRPLPKSQQLSSIQEAYNTAQKAVPGMTITSVIYPGNVFGTPYHFLIYTKGDKALTSRLFTPVLVDANTGKLDAVVNMPVYLKGLEVSRPLHFGDYGGMPLKVIWALFDILAIIVLISGVYLWVVRRKFYADYFLRLSSEENI
ncbi:MAG: PepSY-associated TM helix domain-containing protein [Mucilaginibacter sp.]|uniref:PepSY-associated TM helix domain-containing protein n=1 Tax=Mucilaginibacter sp. TaxID=1882438 RepID=UPI0031B4852C